MTVPDISVIIPHYNDLVRLDRCLDAIDRQTTPRERFEVVVADNMSPVGESAVTAVVRGRATLVMAGEKGAGPARNAGVAAARGRILAFTDADCIPEPGWLAAGVSALDRHDFIGGQMVVVTERGAVKSGAEAFEAVFAFDNRSYVLDKGFTVTANLFCLRSTFDRVGPFRTLVSEDADWCFRARELGFSIGYADDAVVAHPAREDWAALRKKWLRINAESHALALSKPNGTLRWAMHSAALPLSIVAHAPRVLRSPALAGEERLRALATLARIRLWRFGDATLRLFGARS